MVSKEVIESILNHKIIRNSINKQTRKYRFLYDDLAGNLNLLVIESILRFEKDKPIWTRVHPQLFSSTTKDLELCQFKYQLLNYLVKIIRFRAHDIANKQQYCSTDDDIESIAAPTRNTQSYYKRYFWDNFGKLTKRQQQFCIDFMNGKQVCRIKKHYLIKRIGKRLEIGSMNIKNIMLQEEKVYLEKLLAALNEDNFIEIIEKTMDRPVGDWVLYDFMNVELRQKLILYLADVAVNRVMKTPIREVPTQAVEQYFQGIEQWLEC